MWLAHAFLLSMFVYLLHFVCPIAVYMFVGLHLCLPLSGCLPALSVYLTECMPRCLAVCMCFLRAYHMCLPCCVPRLFCCVYVYVILQLLFSPCSCMLVALACLPVCLAVFLTMSLFLSFLECIYVWLSAVLPYTTYPWVMCLGFPLLFWWRGCSRGCEYGMGCHQNRSGMFA